MTVAAPPAEKPASSDLFGHPRGLSVLFATEMWERFAYAGMTAILVFYFEVALAPDSLNEIISGPAITGLVRRMTGLEMPALARQIAALFIGLAFFMPLIGGYIADRFIGQRLMAVFGAMLMAAGYFLMASQQLLFFGLACVIFGMGAFKPNVSTQVGSLYAPGDHRRDRAYSIYYFGINIGTCIAPYVIGTLGERVAWRYGFIAAGIGMLIATAIYLHGMRWLPPDELHRERALNIKPPPLTPHDRRAMTGLLCVMVLVVFFWAIYEQQIYTMPGWIRDFTSRTLVIGTWHYEVPATWFASVNPFLILVLTPIVLRVWWLLGGLGREPSDVSKMAFGFFCLALANVVLAAGAALNDGPADKASPLWTIGYSFIVTVGELHLAPIGLALISRLAPASKLSLMMGLWLAVTLPAETIAGRLSGLWMSMSKPHLFLLFAVIAAAAGVVMFALRPILQRSFAD